MTGGGSERRGGGDNPPWCGRRGGAMGWEKQGVEKEWRELCDCAELSR